MAIKVIGSTVIDDNKVFLPNNSAEVSATATISAGVLALNLNIATVFNVALNSNITSITFSNIQSAGRASSFVLVFTADGTARSVTWPASFHWPGGTAPTLTSSNNKEDVFTFFTTDGGINWQAFVSGQNL
jgi:hypothetical protein